MNITTKNEIVKLLNSRRDTFQRSASAVSRFLGDKFMGFLDFEFDDKDLNFWFDEEIGYDYSVGNNIFAVKVVELGFKDYDSVITSGKLDAFMIVAIYDGEHAVFFGKDNSVGYFKKIADIKIETAEPEKTDKIIQLIHIKDRRDLADELEELFKSMKTVSADQLNELILNSTELVCEVLGREFFDGGEIDPAVLLDCLGNSSNSIGEGSNSEVDVLTDEKEMEYRNQIMTLTNQVASLQEQFETVNSENQKLKDTIDNMEGVELRKAKELLNFIEDGPDKERTYVAVINTELIQNSTLSAFVGNVLQHLSALKMQDAAPFIFNGDMFQIIRDKDSRDMVLNGVNYRIDLDGMSEGDVLNKLRVLFSNFSDIIFLCRTNGGAEATYKEAQNPDSDPVPGLDDSGLGDTAGSESGLYSTESDSYKSDNGDGQYNSDESYNDDSQYNSDEIDTSYGNEQYNPDEVDTSYGGDNQYNQDEQFSSDEYDSDFSSQEQNYEQSNPENGYDSQVNQEYYDDSGNQQGNFDSYGDDGNDQSYQNDDSVEFPEGDSSFDDFGGENDESIDLDFGDDTQIDAGEDMVDDENTVYFACVPIENIIYGDNGFRDLISLDYIMVGADTYDINASGEIGDNNSLFTRCIEGVLASNLKAGRTSIIKEIKQLDLTTVSDLFLPYTNNTAALPRIATTRYVVANVVTLTDVARGIAAVCSALNIDYTDIKLCMSVTVEDASKTDEMWFFDKNVIDDQVQQFESDMPLGMEPEIVPCLVRGNLYSSISVTTDSLTIHENIIRNVLAIKTKTITQAIAHPKDVADLLGEFIFEGMNNGRISNPESIGTLLGTHELIASDNPSRVSNGIEVSSLDNGAIYINGNMSEQQKLYAIIRVYTLVYRDANIVIKVSIDKNALEFYKNRFNTADPIFALSAQSYIEYMYNMYMVSNKR